MRVAELVLLLAAAAAPDPAGAPPSPERVAPGALATDAAPPPAPERPGRRAAAERLAEGDRALATGDLRSALFAFQDAAYLDPGAVAARVKVGRAYLALGYPARARAQAQAALALDAGSADARQLLEEAAAAHAAEDAPAGEAPEQGAPADGAAARPAVVTTAAVLHGTDAAAAERYRAGVVLVARREFVRAIDELDQAIAQDGRLAIAYAARASARFGLGRYREAARDYVSALELDPGLGTPLYGLAECYRLAGDVRAADLYRRYAESRAPDVREDLRTRAARRAIELSRR